MSQQFNYWWKHTEAGNLALGEIMISIREPMEKAFNAGMSAHRKTIHAYSFEPEAFDLDDWIEDEYESIAEAYNKAGTKLKGGFAIAQSLRAAFELGRQKERQNQLNRL